MKKIQITVGPKDARDINGFINDINHNSLFCFENGEWTLKDDITNKKEKVVLELNKLNFINNDDPEKYIDDLFDNIINTAFVFAKNMKVDSKDSNDFQYVNNDNTVIDKIKSTLMKYFYIDDWSIIDLVSDLFSALLNSHLFRNGNKRFCFSFLNVILFTFGYLTKVKINKEFDIDVMSEKYLENIEKTIACFEVRLSNQDIDTLFTNCTNLANQNPLCFEILNSEIDLTIPERHDKTLREIKKWIKNILLFV
ncbi:type II toxin-antitoxin system death-on-curing family toxin [Mycoplasma anserisalpingitidis]|uniref:Type II toxin-antitoxin system death-on-curing family toxin n=1 Tax=Mycoplasma anserisalpingitidis TaxID=519450 RepID=A0A5B8JZW2_9MOLU|nr:type II toxin-antitoxin system death-on-curing family toxin [Mycoplasma anserisalpingitidis]QDY86908.1 type II toxin-antitoxin system death-on-curing family toxin [Mycoplasma anserisalpingitidis]